MLLEKVNIKEEKKLTVEEIRILTGLSQVEFAKNIGIPYSTYVKKEKNITRFFADEIKHISTKFNIPLEKISI